MFILRIKWFKATRQGLNKKYEIHTNGFFVIKIIKHWISMKHMCFSCNVIMLHFPKVTWIQTSDMLLKYSANYNQHGLD